MKKNFTVLFLISFLLGLMGPAVTLAAVCVDTSCGAINSAACTCGSVDIAANQYCCAGNNAGYPNNSAGQTACRTGACAAVAGGGPISSCELKYDFSNACDNCDKCTKGATVSESDTNAWGLCCILNTIYRVTDIVFWLLITGVTLLILVGAYYFLTAGGNPENVRKGQSYILYAMVGLVVAFLAKAIASLIKMLF